MQRLTDVTDHYLDAIVREHAEIPSAILLSRLFEQLHLMFVDQRLDTIGISFPQAKTRKGVGDRLRLHGHEEPLNQFKNTPWLTRSTDYFRLVGPKTVPKNHELRIVRRVQPKLSAASIRRSVRRGSISVDRGSELLSSKKLVNNPYLQIKSLSSGQQFKLFFEQVKVGKNSKVADAFNSYGFGGVIPWF